MGTMILVAAIIGGFIGWLLSWAADYLPHVTGRVTAHSFRTPALWRVVHGKRWPFWVAECAAEVGSIVFFSFVFWHYGFTFMGGLMAFCYAFLLLVTLIDLKYRLVLNIMIYPALLIALAVYVLFATQALPHALVGGGFAFGVFFLTAWIKPGGVGGGDIKLALLIGVILGFPNLLWALLLGTGSGALAALWMYVRQRTLKLHIAYAPFLCLGALIALLYNPLA